jgi:hypothetical protein
MTYRPYDKIIEQAVVEVGVIRRTNAENQSGQTIPILSVVSIDATGRIKQTDVSVEAEAKSLCGITLQSIADNSTGEIATDGIVENITTSLTFGDLVYLSKTGTLTNIIPEIGIGGFVAGDAVIRVGVIARNAANPSNKDLVLRIELKNIL